MRRNLITEARIECEEHGTKNLGLRSPVPRVPVPYEQALRVLFPWQNTPQPGANPYPGFFAGVLALYRGQVRYESIAHWRYGRRQPPDWILDITITALERQAAEHATAARLLRESKKPAQTRTGLKK
jgi:hypothetical protein